MIRISICLVVLELWPKISQKQSFQHFPVPEENHKNERHYDNLWNLLSKFLHIWLKVRDQDLTIQDQDRVREQNLRDQDHSFRDQDLKNPRSRPRPYIILTKTHKTCRPGLVVDSSQQRLPKKP